MFSNLPLALSFSTLIISTADIIFITQRKVTTVHGITSILDTDAGFCHVTIYQHF